MLGQVILLGLLSVANGSDNAKNPQQTKAQPQGYTIHIRELTAPERVVHRPLTEPELVLDALGSVMTQIPQLYRMEMWVIRHKPGGEAKVLRIDLKAISCRGETATNYQLLPGDQLYLQVPLTSTNHR
jgi:hypothetical protein